MSDYPRETLIVDDTIRISGPGLSYTDPETGHGLIRSRQGLSEQYPELSPILKKYAQDWTNEEHNTVMEYVTKLGKEAVQRIMDEQRQENE